jgi:hypothetical protein
MDRGAKACVIKTDGSVCYVDYFGDLYHLYELIGCSHIDYIDLENNYLMYFDDEALLKDVAPNVLASQIVAYCGLDYASGLHNNPLFGNTVLLRKDGDDNYIDVAFNVLSFSLD